MPDVEELYATLITQLADAAPAHSTNRQLIRNVLKSVHLYPTLPAEAGLVVSERYRYGDVKRFGATGLNVASDSAAFANAVAVASPGDTITVSRPSVKYKFDVPWVLDVEDLTVDFEGDECIDATGLLAAIQLEATGIVLNRPSGIGGADPLAGWIGGLGTPENWTAFILVNESRCRIFRPRNISGFTFVIDSHGIEVKVEEPQMLGGCNVGIRGERHSLAITDGHIVLMTHHQVWFDGTQGYAFSNQNHIVRTRMDIPANGPAIKGSGVCNYNYVSFVNIESGDGAATQSLIDKPTGSGWTLIGGHYANAIATTKLLIGFDHSDEIHGGYYAPGTPGVGAETTTMFAYDQSAQANLRSQIAALALVETSPTELAASSNAFNPGVGTIVRISSSVDVAIRGLSGGNPGRTLLMWNIGAFKIEIHHQHASATDPRRFITKSGLTEVLLPNEAAIAAYDSTLLKWRLSRFASYLQGSATYNPPSLADGAGATTTVTVTGAVLGDFVDVSFSLDLQGISVTGYVSAADTVSCRFQNESGGVLDLASGTLRARVRNQ